ncbi:MAG TPA: thiol-disulfide oxidoreductase DCC family protein [Methylomirabilota bacterium]|nr:thiol-disulfide oxidoreductase DCC family protein [Methylomirabilota bacterium]
MSRPIVLFDGVCNLCNGSVTFIVKRDPGRRFRFAALQSAAGATLLRQFGLPADALDTLVLVEGNRAFTRSTASLRVARRLSGLWPLLYALIVVPRPIRDLLYGVVARNRYRWFGRRDACMMPTPDLRERFLE